MGGRSAAVVRARERESKGEAMFGLVYCVVLVLLRGGGASYIVRWNAPIDFRESGRRQRCEQSALGHHLCAARAPKRLARTTLPFVSAQSAHCARACVQREGARARSRDGVDGRGREGANPSREHGPAWPR